MRSIPTRGGAACVLAALSLASTLALAGCSGSSGTKAQPGPGGSTSTTSGSRGASGSGSYGSSSDVVSALKSVGHTCTPVSGSQGTSLSSPGLRSVSACMISGSTSGSQSASEPVTATVFDNHTDAEAYAKLLTSAQSSGLLIGSTSTRAVLGQNWVVLVPDDASYANQVSSALGGTVLGGSGSAAAGG